MADKKISELTAGGSLQSTDLIPIARSGSTLSVLWSAVTGLFAPLTRSINTGTGLQGGGDLSADRTISMVNVGPGVTGPVGDVTHVPVISINAQGQVTALSSTAIALTTNPDIATASLGVDAFWKLNESSGTLAHDSSGNNHNLDSTSTPAWGSAAGPPGTLTPQFSSGNVFGSSGVLAHYAPDLSGDFTFGGWMLTDGPSSTGADTLGIQGPATTSGWSLSIEGASFNTGSRLILQVGAGGGGHLIEGNSALSNSTWYHLMFTHSGSLWTTYVNGVAQSSTFSGSYDAAASTNILLGTFFSGGRLSYVTLLLRALSAAEVLFLASARP